ncbi:hypothetical protein QSV08_11855 [Maribacter sp. BPC-D8]|uniref:hypothetical protein n=1 Tax=Maribacter sp. BPC-D8 TaxID=3053613 RepID=UPI002B4A9242|nr:hypothetical protein [Maribacter sp. BPC-D8]WRI27917.1 hypothetical protein QSV08_11855 [Maribacter sp. BPC-D8]
MKLYPTKTFFVPVAAIIFLLSLSSCGKDYDLVSEYVVRDNAEKVISNNTADSNNFGVAVIDNASTVK